MPDEQLPAGEILTVPAVPWPGPDMYSYVGTSQEVSPGRASLPARLFGTAEAAMAWYTSPPAAKENKTTRQLYRVTITDFRLVRVARPEPYLEVITP